MPPTIHARVATGAIWMVLFKFVERSLGLVSTLILVRLLSPADFGVVAMAISVIAMAELLTAFGFDTALIQDQNATPAHYHTAWTFGVLFGAAVTVVIVLAAPHVAAYYREPGVEWVMYALALGPLITGFQNIGIVAFRKDLRFRYEFYFQVSRKLVGFVITIALAFWYRSYWALIAGTLATQLFSTVVSYWAHPFRPKLTLSERDSLMGFSKWLLFNNIVGYLKNRSSDFVIGRLNGPAGLGLYNVSYELANLPTTELSAPINRALLPGFARLSEDPEELRRIYGSSMSVLALLAVPAAAGIFALAHLIVPVALGAKWMAAIPVLQILAFNGALLMLHSSIAALMIGTGRAKEVTGCNAAFVVILLAAMLALAPSYGVEGAAMACLITAVVSTPIYLAVLRSRLALPVRLFLDALVRPVLASAAMCGMLWLVLPADGTALHAFAATAWLLGGVALGFVVYVAAVVSMWSIAGRPASAERLVIDRVAQELRRRFGAKAATQP
ncbi:MAG: lipopolysaccharide biosynthesis protein [Burkholderiaceae bacterium]|nr:lipopolysaccharide biosynthesis protein [Burkholderiaceae bacterium]